MPHDFLFALWFLLPAAAANVAPILSAKIPAVRQWDAPLDGGRTFRGQRIFGAHKTWRGLVSGVIVATITIFVQQYAIRHLGWAKDIAGPASYTTAQMLLLGPLFAVGALGGDAIESFFKRQRGIESGNSWLLFDQLDYIIGGILVSLPFMLLSIGEYLVVVVVWFVIHLLASYVGYLTGFKDKPI